MKIDHYLTPHSRTKRLGFNFRFKNLCAVGVSYVLLVLTHRDALSQPCKDVGR